MAAFWTVFVNLRNHRETALENCQTGQEADLTLPVEFLHFQHF
jgi:hypothetical protein